MADVEIHWFSIINSFITVLFLSAIFGAIIVRTLSNDIAKYERDNSVTPTPSPIYFSPFFWLTREDAGGGTLHSPNHFSLELAAGFLCHPMYADLRNTDGPSHIP